MSVAAPEQRTIEVGDSRVSYTVAGSGQPLVLLHGWAGFWTHFLGFFGQDTGIKVYAFDMPGWRPADAKAGEHALSAFADAVHAALGAIGLDGKVHVMGQSMGSISALLLADRHPDAVDRLVLASPPVALICPGPKRWLFRRIGPALVRNSLYLRLAEQTHKSRWYNYWLARWTTFYRYDPWFFEEVIMPSALACDEQTSLGQTLSLLDVDVWSLLERTPNPTAVITGDRDPLIPLRMARQVADSLVDGHLFVIPRAKHGIMIEQAEEFRDIALGFLREPDAGCPDQPNPCPDVLASSSFVPPALPADGL